ncbi:MAG: DNA cytosine methyltransferase [Thermoproteales archaeon]|nr:DNA cytosine methyltransferase [Thermoproteales archaeon]
MKLKNGRTANSSKKAGTDLKDSQPTVESKLKSALRASISNAPSLVYSTASLFSGAGGLDLGFVLTGHFAVKFAVELLEPAVRTYSKNFGLPVRCTGDGWNGSAVFKGSVEDVDFRPLKDHSVDILIAGPPCQDFSVVRGPAWDRRGIEVKRGRLYMEFIRALGVLKPKMLVFENVPGLVSSNQGAAYKTILKDFKEAGWEVLFSDIVDSVCFGVPQRRRRLIIVGARRDLLDPGSLKQAPQLFAEHLKKGDPLLAKYPLTPLEAFEGRPLQFLKEKYREIMSEYEDLLGRRNWDIIDDYLKVNSIIPADSEELSEALVRHEKVLSELGWLGRRVQELAFEDKSTDLPREDPKVLQRMRRIPPDRNCEYVRGTEWEVEGRGISLIYRRLHPLKPAYTVVAYGGGGTWGYHYERGRSKMTHRERARLQAFPDWFQFEGGSQDVRAQIGEAVPPLLAKHIASACFEFLSKINSA